MKKRLFILLFVLSISHVFAQSDSITFHKTMDKLNAKLSTVENKINVISANNNRALRNYKNLSSDFDLYKIDAETQLKTIQNTITANSTQINGTAKNLDVKINDTEESANKSITELQDELSQNMLFWVIAFFIIAIFVIIVFFVLRKKNTDLESSLLNKLEEHKKILDQALIDHKNSYAQDLKNAIRKMGQDLKDAQKISGEELNHARKTLSDDLLKTKTALSDNLQFSEKTLEEKIKDLHRVLTKELTDTKSVLEKEDASLASNLTKLQNAQLKMKDKSADN